MSRVTGLAAPILTIILLLVVTAAAGPETAVVPEPDPETMSPSEMHRYLGHRKALGLERARAVRLRAVTAATNQTDYDVKMYDIEIQVNDTTEWLTGRVQFHFEAVVDGLTEVEVDFCELMTVDSIVGPSGALAYSRNIDVVTVNLGTSLNSGDPFVFDFFYQGHPVEGGLQSFEFGSHGGRASISSLSEPYFARSWWPCKDRMDDKADSFKIHIEVDTSLYCASNGTLDSIRAASASSETYHYTEHYPMATYLFSVAIAPFVVWEQEFTYNSNQDTMPIVHHVYTDWDAYSRSTWGKTPDIMTKLSASFGDYPYLDEKYGHANFEWGGGMEHQTMTSMGGNSTFGFSTAVVAHELGHQWWGDMITCASWEDIWLNEGWASYAEAVYYLAGSGWLTYHSYMRGMDYYGPGTVFCDDTTNVWRIFSGDLSYDKGAWVVHMLRGVLGEDKFADGVEAYYNSEFKFAAATTFDFMDVFEGATGEELGWFFADWVYGTYFPKYHYYFMDEPSDSGGFDIYLVVKQVQTTAPQVFRTPVDFYFDETSGPGDTLTLRPDARKKLFKFNRPLGIDNVKLDPADWVLDSSWAHSWEMFITSFGDELSDGYRAVAYMDTVEHRGGSGNNVVTIISGALPDGLSIDNQGIISGVPTDTGDFSFEVHFNDHPAAFSDQAEFTIRIDPYPTCCQPPSVGDIDQSGGIDITDIQILVDNQFLTLTPLTCDDEGDIDGSGVIDITDLQILVDYQFVSLTPLPLCP
ncbi:MAG: hypothetical protein GY867_08135 [bacterium]|nr:hypothetical protein [bacterium]